MFFGLLIEHMMNQEKLMVILSLSPFGYCIWGLSGSWPVTPELKWSGFDLIIIVALKSTSQNWMIKMFCTCLFQ